MPTYKLISSVTLSSTASQISITNIPQTFTDLLLKVSLANTGGNIDTPYDIRQNNVSSGVYGTKGIWINVQNNSWLMINTTTSGTFQNYNQTPTAASAGTDYLSGNEYYIHGYTAQGIYKPIDMRGSQARGTASGTLVGFSGNMATLESPISSIQIIATGAEIWSAGSNYQLYGISNA
jgi:hypothetical protein